MTPILRGMLLALLAAGGGILYFLLDRALFHIVFGALDDPITLLGRLSDPFLGLMLWRQLQWLVAAVLAALLPGALLAALAGRQAAWETLGGGLIALLLFLLERKLGGPQVFPTGFAFVQGAVLTAILPLTVGVFARRRHGPT